MNILAVSFYYINVHVSFFFMLALLSIVEQCTCIDAVVLLLNFESIFTCLYFWQAWRVTRVFESKISLLISKFVHFLQNRLTLSGICINP